MNPPSIASALLTVWTLLSATGCHAPKSKPQPIMPAEVDVPKDFHVRLTSAGVVHWMPRTELVIQADGRGFIERLETQDGSTQPTKHEFTVSSSALLELWRTIRSSGFFDLKEFYRDPQVMDGSEGSIFIQADGKGHAVEVQNMVVPQFGQVGAAIWKAVPKELHP